MILLLAALAHAADLPPVPTPRAPVAGDCPSPTPLPGTVACVAIAEPPSRVAHLEDLEDDDALVRQQYRRDVDACQARGAAEHAELVDLRKLPRPGVARWEGALLGVAASGLVVFAGVEVVRAAGGVR